ncbi:hypothetical protein PFISCL1PPCAC_25580, partial [Pristionchus fissidentatus]
FLFGEMSDDSILLASSSTLLTISLGGNDCSFGLSSDRKLLIIDEISDRLISSVEVKLTRESDSEVISSLLFPIRSPSSLINLRLDLWIPLIFESGEDILSYEILPNHKLVKKKKLSQFTLIFTPIYSTDPLDNSLLTEIYSDHVKIGSTSLAVSRELLSLHSDFFSNLFYGPFMERNQEVKEIKDLSEPEFVGFLQSLHRRKFEFTSVRSALETLGFADRFLMPHISKRVLPYLKKNSLPEELLERALIVADRVPNNEEIVFWILHQFPSKSKLLEVSRDLLPTISMNTSQICMTFSLKRVREMEKYVKAGRGYAKIRKLMDEDETRYGFHLVGYDSKRERVEKESYFCLPWGRPIWPNVPSEYSRVIFNGQPLKGTLLKGVTASLLDRRSVIQLSSRADSRICKVGSMICVLSR